MQSSTLKFDETGEPLPHPTRPRRFAHFAQPGKKLVTRVLRAFPLAAVFLRCSMTAIVAISDKPLRKRTKSGSLTKTHGRSSAAATLLSQIFSSSNLGKTRRSRRPTRYC